MRHDCQSVHHACHIKKEAGGFPPGSTSRLGGVWVHFSASGASPKGEEPSGLRQFSHSIGV